MQKFLFLLLLLLLDPLDIDLYLLITPSSPRASRPTNRSSSKRPHYLFMALGSLDATVQRHGGAGELADPLAELYITRYHRLYRTIVFNGSAISYALKPFAEEMDVTSALNGFVQMAGTAAISLSIMWRGRLHYAKC